MKSSLRTRLAMGAAVIAAAATGYGRLAVAGNCVGAGGVYTCSGAAGADVTQTLSGSPLVVTTTAGFGINTGAGYGFNLTGAGGLAFADNFSSAITGAASGINAANDTIGSLTITTTGTVTGKTKNGIDATDSGSGSLSITTNDVNGEIAGISAKNSNGGALTIDSSLGTVNGGVIFGIVAVDDGSGLLSITTNDVSGGLGIQAQNKGGGDLSIDTSLGSVSGSVGSGILAFDYQAGAISVIAKHVSGSRAIDARNDGGGNMTITTNGIVDGSFAAIYAKQTGAGDFTVTNGGTLRNSALDVSALSLDLRADTAGVTFDNLDGGTIIGRASLTAVGDQFNNGGLWQMTGASSFGGGADELFNKGSGVIQTAFNGGVETASLTGLETFRNVGSLRLQDGEIGDSLSLSGDLIGEPGGSLWLDVFLDDGSTGADRLLVGGATSGATEIALNVIGGLGAATGAGVGNGIALIEVSGTTQLGDFVLLGGPKVAGTFFYDLALESDNIWYLQSKALPAIGGYANAVSGLQGHARFMQDLLFEHLDELRHLPRVEEETGAGQTASLGIADLADGGSNKSARPGGLSLWLRAGAFGGEHEPSGSPAYEQNGNGFAMGGEVAFDDLLATDRLYLGALAGYGASDGDQGDGVEFAFDGWSFGVYAAYLQENETASPYDGLQVNLAAGLSLLDVEAQSTLPLAFADYDATAWNVAMEAAYGFAVGSGLIVEPKAGLTYSNIRHDDFTDSLGVAVSLEEGESLEGAIGLRIQQHWNLYSLGSIAPYVQGSVIHEFLGENRIAANGIGFDSSVEGTRYSLELGLDAQVGTDLSLFGSVDLSWGENLNQSIQALGGARLAF